MVLDAHIAGKVQNLNSSLQKVRTSMQKIQRDKAYRLQSLNYQHLDQRHVAMHIAELIQTVKLEERYFRMISNLFHQFYEEIRLFEQALIAELNKIDKPEFKEEALLVGSYFTKLLELCKHLDGIQMQIVLRITNELSHLANAASDLGKVSHRKNFIIAYKKFIDDAKEVLQFEQQVQHVDAKVTELTAMGKKIGDYADVLVQKEQVSKLAGNLGKLGAGASLALIVSLADEGLFGSPGEGLEAFVLCIVALLAGCAITFGMEHLLNAKYEPMLNDDFT